MSGAIEASSFWKEKNSACDDFGEGDFGPDAGLALVAGIAEAAAFKNYAPLPAAKGDFLLRAGRPAAARIEFERAAGLTRNLKERSFLLGRVASCR